MCFGMSCKLYRFSILAMPLKPSSQFRFFQEELGNYGALKSVPVTGILLIILFPYPHIIFKTSGATSTHVLYNMFAPNVILYDKYNFN